MPLNQWSPAIFILELHDEPAFSEESDAFATRLDDPAASIPHLIIDLANVRFVSSSNLAQILRLRKRILAADRHLYLANVSDAVWSVFITTGLDLILNFSSDLASALAAAQLSAPAPPSSPRRPAGSPPSSRTKNPPRHP